MCLTQLPVNLEITNKYYRVIFAIDLTPPSCEDNQNGFLWKRKAYPCSAFKKHCAVKAVKAACKKTCGRCSGTDNRNTIIVHLSYFLTLISSLIIIIGLSV